MRRIPLKNVPCFISIVRLYLGNLNSSNSFRLDSPGSSRGGVLIHIFKKLYLILGVFRLTGWRMSWSGSRRSSRPSRRSWSRHSPRCPATRPTPPSTGQTKPNTDTWRISMELPAVRIFTETPTSRIFVKLSISRIFRHA